MYGGGDGTPKLDIKHLFEKRQTRDTARLKAYNQILGQIHSRIYTVSQMTGNTNTLVYTVPPFILGFPAIDLQDCIVYLVSMLRNGGFVVRYTYPNLLFVSWKHYEREYNQENNPIVRAMMPPAAPTSKKGKEGNRGTSGGGERSGFGSSGERSGFSNSHSVSFAPLPTSTDTAPRPQRSTAEYRPPDSFMQSLTKPANEIRPSGGPPVAKNVDVLADLWKF